MRFISLKDSMLALSWKLLVATSSSILSYFVTWWVPLIAFPLCTLILPLHVHYHRSVWGRIQIMRTIVHFILVVYVASQTILFQEHIGSWYGWLFGLVPSWILAGIMAAILDDRLRWKEVG